MIAQCIMKHHDSEHIGPLAIDTSIVYLANQLSQQPPVSDEEGMQAILSTIPNWDTTKCTLEQITIACELAEGQWREVMESLGMGDMEINDEEDWS